MNKLKLTFITLVLFVIVSSGVIAINNKMNGDESYIGLTEYKAVDKAQNRNVPYRIIRRDRESMPATDDYISNRLNFEVDDGIVTKASEY